MVQIQSSIISSHELGGGSFRKNLKSKGDFRCKIDNERKNTAGEHSVWPNTFKCVAGCSTAEVQPNILSGPFGLWLDCRSTLDIKVPPCFLKLI